MSMLFDIVYATKANGTHHKLAMDALRPLKNEHASDWQRLFLKHIDVYLEGAKAPDRDFKDFKNHVLHVGDEFWGGAPMKASVWYDKLVRALSDRQFEEAVYCAGVLSHYYTDPIQPFHTAQCEAENNMHRAVEWSINKSYKMLRQRGQRDYADLAVKAGDDDDWIGEMVRRGAMRSHQYYDALISNYNLDKGVVDPLAGLNENCHRFLSELLTYAALGFSHILDRAFVQAAITPPKVNLSLDIFIASLGIPLRWLLRKLDDAEQIKAVQAAYDELQQTGKVEKHLNEDDRAVRELYQKEVVECRFIKKGPNWHSRPQSRKIGLSTTQQKKSPLLSREKKTPSKQKKPENTPLAAAAPAEAPAQNDKISPAVQAEEKKQKRLEKSLPTKDRKVRAPRFYLEVEDNIEKAPSIGRKTADRLERIGIHKIADLLSADPAEIASQLETKWIRETIVKDWQDQARLVCEVAGLRGGHSQILVAAGIRTRRALVKMTSGELHAMITLYCQTKEGQNLRACESIPDKERVESWIKASIEHPRTIAA